MPCLITVICISKVQSDRKILNFDANECDQYLLLRNVFSLFSGGISENC